MQWMISGGKNVLCDLVIIEQISYNLMSNMFIESLYIHSTGITNKE